MKKICIYLIKVHRFYYLLLGVLIAVIIFSVNRNAQEMLPFSDMNPYIPILLLVSPILINGIAFAVFYTEEERKTKDINTFQGLVQWDNYFPEKINSQPPMTRRIFGYFYAILRSITYIQLSYFSTVVVCLLIYK